MAQWRDLFRLETVTGEPIRAGGVTLRPQSQAAVLRWSPSGGLVWNRPLAVLVERNGETERIPIVDVTRIAQLSLLAATLLVVMVVRLLSLKASSKAGGQRDERKSG